MPRQVAAKNSEAVDDVDFVINTSDEETESGEDSMEEEEDVEEVLDVTNIKLKGKRTPKRGWHWRRQQILHPQQSD